MQKKVIDFLNKNQIYQENKTYLVGFSGGYDSMCLLDILNKIFKNTTTKIIALHLNHNWRGEEANNEELNCSKFCKENNITFISEKLPKGTPKTETVAREKRHQFFLKYYKKYDADGLFLAHTKSDNTETILYRLAKGTGVIGLCGIAPTNKLHNMQIFRPLLEFSRNDILNYCKLNKLNPNNDSSNNDNKYARNFIRNKVIPELKQINKNLDDSILNLSSIAQSEQNIINEYIEKIKKEISKEDYLITKKFEKQSKDIKNRIILDLLIQNNLDYDSNKIEEISLFINENKQSKTGKTLSLTKDLWLFVSQEKIKTITYTKTEKITNYINIDKCGSYKFQNKIFILEKFEENSFSYPKENELNAYVNLPQTFSLTLRTRRDGDIIQPFGMKGKMKLKKYFINKGIEKHKRDEVLLLCNENEILWAIGIGISEKLKVEKKPSHYLRIKE